MTFQGFEKSKRPGASANAIATLEGWAGTPPALYLDLLRFRDGAEDWNDLGIVLWSAKEVAELNEDYGVAEFAPALLIVDSNGGGEAIALDRRHSSEMAVSASGSRHASACGTANPPLRRAVTGRSPGFRR
jgi:hypothetical protein